MKKLYLILVFGLLLAGFLAAEIVNLTPLRHNQDTTNTAGNRFETVWFHETFEDGAGAWYSEDGQVPDHNWHLTNNPALTHQGSGQSWWMGNPNMGTNGGYTNGHLIYLQTPAITVPASNSNLTFDVNWHVEELGGDIIDGVMYDGWDGANVRISTNGGVSWSTIEPTSPEYNSLSMYGFGYNGEGGGVPGWGHTSQGWQQATFNLSAYSGQSVMIRWVFGSDPAYNTENNPAMFGIVIDNISLGSFVHNFDDGNTQGMTAGSLKETGGDLWHLGTDPTSPNPPNIFLCQNEQGEYNNNMMNYLYSSWIDLPDYDDIRMDFNLKGGFNDQGNFPNVNYIGVEIRAEGGPWNAISNPYGGDLPNYVYSSVPDIWWSFTEAYSAADGMISELRGQKVQFRWYLRTLQYPINGEGLLIDNLIIYHIKIPRPPENLTATVNEDNTVTLNWTAPNYGPDLTHLSNKIYRRSGTGNFVEIGNIGAEETSFTDENPVLNVVSTYHATSVYAEGESVQTENISVFLVAPSVALLQHDDGTAEDQTIGASAWLNRFTIDLMPGEEQASLIAMSFYLRTISGTAFRVQIFDELDGLPNEMIFEHIMQTSGTINLGWNTFVFANPPDVKGNFFIGFYGPALAPRIGIDDSTSGMSFTRIGQNAGDFEVFEGGVYMIRVYADNVNDEIDITLPEKKLSAINYPNPFNPETTISFNMPVDGQVSVQVFNIRGQLVNTLLNEEVKAGNHTVNWTGFDHSGRAMSSGVYFYRVQTADDTVIKKMLLMK